MTRISRIFGIAAAGLLVGAAALSGSARASPLQYAGVCPSTVGHVISGTAGAGARQRARLQPLVRL